MMKCYKLATYAVLKTVFFTTILSYLYYLVSILFLIYLEK